MIEDEKNERYRQKNGEYHIFQLRVPIKLWGDMRSICFVKNRSISSMIIEALKFYLNNIEKTIDAGK